MLYMKVIKGVRRSPGEENDNPLQYSCLENLLNRGAWQATVHGIAKSQTRLSNYTTVRRANTGASVGRENSVMLAHSYSQGTTFRLEWREAYGEHGSFWPSTSSHHTPGNLIFFFPSSLFSFSLSLSLLLSSFWLNQEGINFFIEINDQSLVLPGS